MIIWLLLAETSEGSKLRSNLYFLCALSFKRSYSFEHANQDHLSNEIKTSVS